MRYALIPAIFAVFFFIGPASAQPEAVGHCFLNGEEYEPGSDLARSAIAKFVEESNPMGPARMAANLCVDIIVEKHIQIEYSRELQAGIIILDAKNTAGGTYHYAIIVETGSLTKRQGPVDASWDGSIEKAALDTLPSPNPGAKPWHLIGLAGGLYVVVAIEPSGPVAFPDPIYQRDFHNCIHVGLFDEPNSGTLTVNVPPENFCLGGCNNLLPIQFTF